MPSSYQSARLPRARAAAETTSASWAAGLRAESAPCTAPPCRTERARNSATSAVARAPPGRGTSRARRRARPTAGELVMLIGGGGKTCEVTGRVKKINVFPLFFSAIRPPPFFSFAFARHHISHMAAPARELYENPLVSRYASKEMSYIWSPAKKFSARTCHTCTM